MFSKMYFSESTEISVSLFAFRSKILFSYFEIVVNAINIGLSQTCDWTVFRASNLWLLNWGLLTFSIAIKHSIKSTILKMVVE